MATIIDEDENNNEQQEAEQFDTLDEQETQDTQLADSDEEQPEEEDDIPEKYKGKSVKEIVRMHQEAEKAMGKQGSEVGELRRIVDSYIQAQSVAQQQQAPNVEEEVDFFADPDKAIERAIAKHPKVQQAEQLAQNMQKAEASARLQAAHPDFANILQDPGFAEWIGKSQVRQELFARADARYDFNAADELLTTWKERQNIVRQAADAEKIGRKHAVKAAATGSTKGSGETASKKVYRRQDIIELMQRDPDRYQALSGEIMQAYAENRVR